MAMVKHAIPSELKINIEFEASNVEDSKTFYNVHCRTYDAGTKRSEHKIADALYEEGIGLWVFPIGGEKVHKLVANSYVKQFDVRLSKKAKWEDNGFLFKEH
jgi:hypothetical protein